MELLQSGQESSAPFPNGPINGHLIDFHFLAKSTREGYGKEKKVNLIYNADKGKAREKVFEKLSKREKDRKINNGQ